MQKIAPRINPPNPWRSSHTEWIGEPPPQPLEVFEQHVKEILAANNSPDVPFTWSLNPYRGCYHACAYCYARPSHQHLDFGAGVDFERKIVVKVNAAERLRATFMRRSWQGESISISGNTDPYQPLEANYQLTRRCLEICLEFQNPAGIITKGALIRRDVELIAELHRRADAIVFVSIPFLDPAVARALEPGAPPPDVRFRVVEALANAGIPVGVSLSPLIPALNDSDVPAILKRAAAAGATRAFFILLRLAAEVKDVFIPRLEAAFPDRAARIINQLRETKNGALNRSNFGARMRGEGPRYEAARDLFDLSCRKLGLNVAACATERPSTFRRPSAQTELFG